MSFQCIIGNSKVSIYSMDNQINHKASRKTHICSDIRVLSVEY